jgi:hypothetical protein
MPNQPLPPFVIECDNEAENGLLLNFPAVLHRGGLPDGS